MIGESGLDGFGLLDDVCATWQRRDGKARAKEGRANQVVT